MNYHVETLIGAPEIEKRVSELADQLVEEYKGEMVKLICVLKGGVFFLVELAKHLGDRLPVEMDFMDVSSYGNGTETTGAIKILKDLDDSISGQHVIIIEDIIDTGVTLSQLRELLLKRDPKSVRICTLLSKPARRRMRIEADYTGFEIPDKFVVGYGLDYAQRHRTLPYIGVVVFDEE
ncbi:MAG: hypoxanthine phosphoribosyltransferase [Lachnospiraceae bacterium]|nr:hypoxanthine phosphoribosyltransferase [Lachnospiraceae bacterium]